MSLFENSEYMYRDTFFVFMKNEARPTSEQIRASFEELGKKYQITDIRSNDGSFESMTVLSPYDFSAMDIVYVEGDEVTGQITELMEEFRTMTLVGDDHQKLKKVVDCNARFDIFHFEQVADTVPEGNLDPGGLLIVLEKLAALCDGVGLDPQSNTLM